MSETAVFIEILRQYGNLLNEVKALREEVATLKTRPAIATFTPEQLNSLIDILLAAISSLDREDKKPTSRVN